MMRLQALYREIASPNGCDLAVLERIGLRDEQINRIHQEVADLLLSPLGVDLMIELLPPLIAISTRGAKLNRTADI